MNRPDLNALADRITEAAGRAVADEAEVILDEATRIVPIEEGALARSGKVAADGLEAHIGFGSGAAAPYAVRQHEDLSLRHDAGRTGKYLERPLMAAKAGFSKQVAEAIRRVL